MKDEILSNFDNPAQLEKLYRSDKPAFKRSFLALYPELKDNHIAGFWYERINFAQEEAAWGSLSDLLFVVIASLLAGVAAKLPSLFSIDESYFYPRNIGFIILPVLTAYFAWKNKLSSGKIAFIAVASLAGLVFINSLPNNPKSDTLILSCIYLVLFLWCLLGFAFGGNNGNRLGFLRYNGDLVVMTTLILIAGGIMTGITIGLFKLIGFQIEQFYFQNVVTFGLPAAPITGNYLIRANPQLVGKVSPVIARIFSPLVLVMLLVYLVAIIYSGKNPYNDREFLLFFNALLIGVMAIIFFSIAEGANTSKSRPEVWILFLLSVVTILVNGIALSAILIRISSGGITPNRAAVMGGNILILVNLLLVTVRLFKVLSKKSELTGVRKVIGNYLNVYFVWTIIVTFLFPLIFGFR